VILLRPTQSTGLYLQQVGRALRTADGKDHAVILDHAGNGLRHGLPNQIREWSLDAPPRGKRSKSADVLPIKQCMSCYAVHAPAPACPECGHVYVTEARKIEQVDGELVEISADIVLKQKKREQGSAKTLEDLIALGRSRGHKNPEGWAKHVHKARMMKHG
jgi:DNA repair protein RadD